MIKRETENEINALIGYFPAIGIIGPRQVGKTTLAKKIKLKDKESIYLDLELPDDLAKLNEPSLFFNANSDQCIILDEVQRKPDLFPILRAVIDQKRVPGRFLLLGSASPELIRDSSESLAGRIAYKELTPLNLMEVTGESDYQTHWLKGGFPNAFLAPNSQLRKAWFQNFIQTYIERDIPQLGLKVSPVILHRFVQMLCHFHGNVWNANNFSKSLELTGATIKKYLYFLSEAFLVNILPPYSPNIKKRIVKSPKIYIRDSGLLHHLLHIYEPNDLYGHIVLGHSWEGYVIEQIKQLFADSYEFCFYRTHKGAECDLLLLKAGKPEIAIEIKYTSTPKLTKGFLNSIEDLNTKNNFIITPDTDSFLIRENVEVCSLTSFLKKLKGS